MPLDADTPSAGASDPIGPQTQPTETIEAAGGAPAGKADGAAPDRPGAMSRGRATLIYSLIGLTTLLTVVAIFSVYANRLLFNPDNWASNSTQLLQDPNIRSATANYVVDQLYSNVDVPGLIKSGLPTQLQGLAAPAAGALRNVAVQGIDFALSRPRVQQLWSRANRAADQTFVAIVNGGKGPVKVNQGAVTLDLGAIAGNVATRLGLPSGLAAKLPPNVANLTVFKSNQLSFVQKVGNAIQGLALWLTILCPILYALAIFITPPGRRYRTLIIVGAAMVLAGILAVLGRSLLESQVAGALTTDASLRVTIRRVVLITSSILGEISGAVILVGAVLVGSGWFGGRSAPARSGRRAIAPFLRERPVESYAITVAVMILVFIWNPIPATGKLVGILVFLVLALFGTYVLRRQTGSEFPDARTGEVTARLAAATRRARPSPKPPNSPPANPGTISEQLNSLSELRARGELTPDEFQAAKNRLLQG